MKRSAAKSWLAVAPKRFLVGVGDGIAPGSAATGITYTNGPWVADGYDQKSGSAIVHSRWGEVARVVFPGSFYQQTANARLIAASPELLAACNEALGLLSSSMQFPKSLPAVKQLRAAIAKAGAK